MLAAVSTVKAPSDQLLAFVNYHLNIGIDRLYLYFDDPEDPAIDLLQPYTDVTITVCDSEYWMHGGSPKDASIELRQIRNANHVLTLARTHGIDWITHIDSDELIYPASDIKEYLAELAQGVNLVRMRIGEAVGVSTSKHTIFDDIKYFKNRAGKKKIDEASDRGCLRPFFYGEYFRAHVQSKCIVRTSSPVKSMKIHTPEATPNSQFEVLLAREIRLLHYDCTSFDSWKEKWLARLDGTATAARMRKNRRRQMSLFTQYFRQGDDENLHALFERLHCLKQDDIPVLLNLDMLAEINIEPSLFEAQSQFF